MPEYKRPIDSQKYWEQRSLEVSESIWKDTKKVEKEMALQYKLAMDDITKEVQSFIERYGAENKLTYSEAIKMLSNIDQQGLLFRLNQMQQRIMADPSSSMFLKSEVQKIVAKLQFDRLNGLFALIEMRTAELTEQIFNVSESHLSTIYASSYYQTLYTVDSAIVGASFVALNESAIKKAITYRWSGEQFSERIWSNRDKLVTNVRQIVTQGIIQGTSTQKMSRVLRDAMDTSYFNANRVIRTETAFVLNEGANDGYKASGVVEKYLFIATLDGKTSKTCGVLDGKTFKLDERLIGTNAPPMHPFCRSTTAPYFGELPSSRRARNEDGSNEIIKYQTYEEWKKSKGV